MPRVADPDVRSRLIDAAMAALAAGEEPSLRPLAAAAGTSTMAVYTHFGGMPGLWLAVRERAFDALAERLRQLDETDDPVADLVASGVAYAEQSLADPALFHALFEVRRTDTQPASAVMTFAVLVGAVERAVAAGRLASRCDPIATAIRLWAMTHGVLVLVSTQALPDTALDDHLPPMYTAQLVAQGDGPRRAAKSVRAGWSTRTTDRPSPDG
ncbi:MAG: TetR/AcrR family transcriptional regulator [Ilumatobacter sp.]|uniref:TetR/AcrR family transcriptional regulator n=1 Tax=Ilumatobacter sp. TaxID=1967498 RepID=UPI003296E0E6